MTTVEKPGFCTLCRSRCGSINVVANDRLVSVRPDQRHPTGKAMCTKGKAAPELVDNPRRLLYPMRRTRPKGDPDPGWQRISWDEALDEVAGRMARVREQYGAEAVAFGVTTPSGTPLCDSIEWIERFIRIFGSPNICYATEICNWHKDHAHAFTFGCSMPTADYANSDLILLWGHNPANVWLSQAAAISEGRLGGAKLMVVDPRRTALAGQAEHWLRVRPGADAALALGLIHLLVKNRRFDERFVRAWTNAPFLVREDNGLFLRERDLDPHSTSNHCLVWSEARHAAIPYDPKADHAKSSADYALYGEMNVRGLACHTALQRIVDACEAYTPERVAAVTSVPEDQIRAAAQALGEAQRIAYHSWTGIGQQVNATQTERAIAVLYALTGSFDTKGGNVIFGRQPVNSVNGWDLFPKGQRDKALGINSRPLGPPSQGWITARDLYHAITEGEPYPVRAFVGFGSNPLVAQADVQKGQQAFTELEFHVHCDLFETPTSRYADILLPVNSPWEREGLRVGFEISAEAQSLIQLRPRMVTPRGESRSDNEIVFELAKRLGMADQFFGGSLDAGWNHILAPTGVDVQMLRDQPEGIRRPLSQSFRKYAHVLPDGAVQGFATETGRVELYSEKLARHGYSPVPLHRESKSSSAEFPYQLTSAKSGYYCHSQHRSLASLRKRAPFPYVEMHSETAKRHGIRESDWAVVRTQEGRARFKAKLNDSLHPWVVVADYGWWQACEDLGRPSYPVSGDFTSSFNALISADEADPISGSVPHRAFHCAIEVDVSDEAQRLRWMGFKPFLVRAVHEEAEGVVCVELESEEGDRLPDYEPGQYVSLRISSVPAHGEVTRTYSLIGAAQESERRAYRVAVKHVSDGAMSPYIAQKMRPGDVVRLQAPTGNFVLPRNTDLPVVLVAGGIGITPFLSYLESLQGRENIPDVTLHYATQNSATHAFKDRLNALCKRIPQLQLLTYYEQPLPQDKVDVDFQRRGRVSACAFSDKDISSRARFYLCGPGPMMQGVTEALLSRGVPRFDIFKEEFRSPIGPLTGVNRSFNVHFARSKCQATWTPSDGSLLAFGEALGISMPSGCRVGQCESCVLDVVEGHVSHLTPMLGAEDDKCFACQAVPSSNLVLDI